jgi:PAS domain S-box-containing protein
VTRSTDDLTNRHLARVVESSDDAIISKNLDGIIVSWNRAAERMFGYTADEAIGRSIRMIIPDDRQSEEDMLLGEVRAGRAVSHFETLRRTKTGEFVPISLSVSPIHDDDGRVIGASKIARDISDRMRADLTARHLAAVVQSSDDAIITIDLSGSIISWNPAAERMFGYTEHEAVGRSIGMLMPADRQREEDSVLARIRAGQSVDHFETLRQHKSGTTLAISLTVSPIRDQAGTVVGASKVARDISERVRLQALAHQASRAKDDFLAVLSHELRTPLHAIVGYTRLLRGGVLTGEKAVNAIEALERNAHALNQMVDDVLDISRIVSGKVRLDVQPMELSQVVHNAISTVLPAAEAKGVRIETVIDPRSGPISGDPARLQQVVWNLLSNAVKFTPRDGRVHVSVERVNSRVELTISDTGIGIPPQFLPHVFDQFSQAETGLTRRSGGLGLGLSIVKHIVEMHGGAVEASSAGPGQGATFRVRLPTRIVYPTAKDVVNVHPTTSQLPITALGSLNGLHVLAVDDEVEARTLLRVVLEAAGAEVDVVGSARDALAYLETMRPDVMLADVGMPEMDGFELITRVRSVASPDVRDVPAAALTAFARPEDRTKALQSGFEMHLAKPVDPGELVAAVATLVRRRRR